MRHLRTVLAVGLVLGSTGCLGKSWDAKRSQFCQSLAELYVVTLDLEKLGKTASVIDFQEAQQVLNDVNKEVQTRKDVIPGLSTRGIKQARQSVQDTLKSHLPKTPKPEQRLTPVTVPWNDELVRLKSEIVATDRKVQCRITFPK